MIAAFVIGVVMTGTSGPERPGLHRWQQPGMGAVLVGAGALMFVVAVGAEISLLRDRRRYSDARRPRSLGYRRIQQSLWHNLWTAPISVGVMVATGLWLRHRYG
jgi:hypothetical protein